MKMAVPYWVIFLHPSWIISCASVCICLRKRAVTFSIKLLHKNMQLWKQTMMTITRQPGVINISGQIKFCSNPFNRRSPYKMPVTHPQGSITPVYADCRRSSKGKGRRDEITCAFFSKKSVYRIFVFSLTEPELPEMQSIYMSHICGPVKVISCLWSVTVPKQWWQFTQQLSHAVFIICKGKKKPAKGYLTKIFNITNPK